jgi:hypothetical protein
MVSSSTRKVTVDRISNSGNAIAQQQHAGKTIHVPAGDVGETLEVKLIDQGAYFEARLVDKTDRTTPSQPSTSPDTSDVGQELLGSSDSSHSYTVRSSPAGGDLRGTVANGDGVQMRSRMAQRKK